SVFRDPPPTFCPFLPTLPSQILCNRSSRFATSRALISAGFSPSSLPAVALPALTCVKLVEKPRRSRYISPALLMLLTSTLCPWQENLRPSAVKSRLVL